MKSPRAVRIWLATCAALVFAMIVVGGITRITRSGLSITEWNPVVGALPPLGDRAWADAFARYQATPEGRLVNAGMTLAQFRDIFWVEYVHRLLGRVVAFALLVPLVVFLLRRTLPVRRALALFGLLGAVGLQGALGWYMVASGLVDAPHVSPLRLASHLVFGMALLGWLVWSAHDPLAPPGARSGSSAGVPRSAWLPLALLGVTIGYGGLMAGHHAGYLCSTFPTMNGAWWPPNLQLGTARGLLADGWTIHFVHRGLAVATAVGIAFAARSAWARGSSRTRMLAACVVGGVGLQVGLGAWLVAAHMPPSLAVIHQANAALVLVLLVSTLASWRYDPVDISHP